MSEIVIAGAVRTPVGSFNGAFASLPAHKLGEIAIRDVLSRAKVAPAEVSEVILGQVLAAGQGMNPARQAALNAGLPDASTALVVNQVCGSGLRSIAMGARDRGRTGEHEQRTALCAFAERRAHGRCAADRHDDPRRAVGHLQRLPHGCHGGECCAALANFARSAGPVRSRLAIEGRGRTEGRPVQGRDRAGHRSGPEGRRRGRRGRISEARHDDRGAAKAQACLPERRNGHRRQRIRHQ